MDTNICVFFVRAPSRISLVYLASFFSLSLHPPSRYKHTHRHSRVWSSAHNIHLLRTSKPPWPPVQTTSATTSDAIIVVVVVVCVFFVRVLAGSAGRYELAAAPVRQSRRNSQRNHPLARTRTSARAHTLNANILRAHACARTRERRIRLRADTKPCISLIYGRSDTTQRTGRTGWMGVGRAVERAVWDQRPRVRARKRQSERRRASARARNCRKW